MAWVAVDQSGAEYIYDSKPERGSEMFKANINYAIDKGTIKMLIGRTLTWSDDPVELKEVEK